MPEKEKLQGDNGKIQEPLGFTLLSEGEEPLPKVVQAGVQHHACQHGHVFLDRFAVPRQCPAYRRPSQTVGHTGAHRPGEDEAEDLGGGALPVLKGEILVEEEAQNAPNHIVGAHRHPVVDMSQVVQQEHYPGAHQSVGHANQEELPNRGVKQFFHPRHPPAPAR